MIAAAIALNILFITQRRRKQRQGKELITYVLGKLFAGRNGAEAIAGHHHFHFCDHFQNNRNTHRHPEHIIAQIRAGHADRTSHTLQFEGNDRFIRHGEQYVFIDGDHALADVFDAAAVCKQDIDRDMYFSPHPGKAGAVAQPFHIQITDIRIRRTGTAAFKRDRRDRCGGRHIGFDRSITAVTVAVAAIIHNLCITGDRHVDIGQLLLLQATVVNSFHLNAYFFLNTIQGVGGIDRAGATIGVGVFVGIKGHKNASLTGIPFRAEERILSSS